LELKIAAVSVCVNSKLGAGTVGITSLPGRTGALDEGIMFCSCSLLVTGRTLNIRTKELRRSIAKVLLS
jgi:hypothetical protein